MPLNEINDNISRWAGDNLIAVEFFQANCEGAIIDKIHQAIEKFDCLIINPGAYTHYSYAIRDAIEGVGIPAFEVHLTNISAREDFRRISVVAPVCQGSVSGFAETGYLLALMGAKLLLSS